MISPATYNFTIYQGATFERSFQVKGTDGNNLPTFGFDVRMQIRKSVDTATTVLSLTVGGGLIAINTTGLITVFIPAGTTATLPGGEILAYDLEMIDGTNVDRILMGTITVSAEVTR